MTRSTGFVSYIADEISFRKKQAREKRGNSSLLKKHIEQLKYCFNNIAKYWILH